MFLHPSSDLREQVLGHVDGAGLAPLGEGDLVGGVQRATVVAGAGRLAAAFVHLGQAGRQERARGSQLLESPLEHPTDQGGVARHMHRWAPGTPGKCTLYRERPQKPGVRRKKWARWDRAAQQAFVLSTYAAVKVRRISPFLNAGSCPPLCPRCPTPSVPPLERWPGSAPGPQFHGPDCTRVPGIRRRDDSAAASGRDAGGRLGRKSVPRARAPTIVLVPGPFGRSRPVRYWSRLGPAIGRAGPGCRRVALRLVPRRSRPADRTGRAKSPSPWRRSNR